MIKIIDIDKLFEKYIKGYVLENIGKVKPEEIENKIPELYVKFGNEKLNELDGKTPSTYYKDFSAFQLVQCLQTHLKQGVEVSDFLCEALAVPSSEDALVKAIESDGEEEFIVYIMNMLSDIRSQKCFDRYLQFISWDYGETIKELATEHLREWADSVKEKVLALYNQSQERVKEYLVEILVGCSKDDRVFDILIEQFCLNTQNVPLYANYLAKYGDERALPYLMKEIEKEKITYADFEELRFAIEALGGEYNKIRSFKADKTFEKIKGCKNPKPLS